MQSTLSGFEPGTETDGNSDSAVTDETTVAVTNEISETPIVTGELPRGIAERIARQAAGTFEYLRFSFDSDGVLITPFKEPDRKEMMSYAVSVPASDWESYSFTGYPSVDKAPYVIAVDPYRDVLDPIRSTDEETITIRITPGGESRRTQEALHSHGFEAGEQYDDALNTAHIDEFDIASNEALCLRDPARDPLFVDAFSYETSMTVTDWYQVRQWMQSQVDDGIESVLIAGSTGQRGDERRSGEYILSFTPIQTDPWEQAGDSLLLDDSSSAGISDATVRGPMPDPSDKTLKCLPEPHYHATNISYGFYRPEHLHNVLKHVLKNTFTAGRMELHLNTEFPLEITAPVTETDQEIRATDEFQSTHADIDTTTDSTDGAVWPQPVAAGVARHVISPVVSPDS